MFDFSEMFSAVDKVVEAKRQYRVAVVFDDGKEKEIGVVDLLPGKSWGQLDREVENLVLSIDDYEDVDSVKLIDEKGKVVREYRLRWDHATGIYYLAID